MTDIRVTRTPTRTPRGSIASTAAFGASCMSLRTRANRCRAARLRGEAGAAPPAAIRRWGALARDAAPSVRLSAAAAARQFVSGALTVDTPPKRPDAKVGGIIAAVVEASADAKDPLIPFMA